MQMSKNFESVSDVPEMFAINTIGPGTTLRLGVGVIIRDIQNRILLERRSDCGWWGIPGGSLEVGESIRETAIREVKEETGLEIKIVRLVGVYSVPHERIVTYPDTKDGLQIIDVVVEGTVLSGQLTCSDESLDLQYFPIHQLPAELVPPSRQPIKDVVLGMYGTVE
ncbi:MAG: NUDIX domain-containing protein [Nitrospirales bacterium]